MTNHLMANLSERQAAACDGYTAIACMRLGLDDKAYEWAIHAARHAARALGLGTVSVATIGR